LFYIKIKKKKKILRARLLAFHYPKTHPSWS
jgi:hypothetical protein